MTSSSMVARSPAPTSQTFMSLSFPTTPDPENTQCVFVVDRVVVDGLYQCMYKCRIINDSTGPLDPRASLSGVVSAWGLLPSTSPMIKYSAKFVRSRSTNNISGSSVTYKIMDWTYVSRADITRANVISRLAVLMASDSGVPANVADIDGAIKAPTRSLTHSGWSSTNPLISMLLERRVFDKILASDIYFRLSRFFPSWSLLDPQSHAVVSLTHLEILWQNLLKTPELYVSPSSRVPERMSAHAYMDLISSQNINGRTLTSDTRAGILELERYSQEMQIAGHTSLAYTGGNTAVLDFLSKRGGMVLTRRATVAGTGVHLTTSSIEDRERGILEAAMMLHDAGKLHIYVCKPGYFIDKVLCDLCDTEAVPMDTSSSSTSISAYSNAVLAANVTNEAREYAEIADLTIVPLPGNLAEGSKPPRAIFLLDAHCASSKRIEIWMSYIREWHTKGFTPDLYLMGDPAELPAPANLVQGDVFGDLCALIPGAVSDAQMFAYPPNHYTFCNSMSTGPGVSPRNVFDIPSVPDITQGCTWGTGMFFVETQAEQTSVAMYSAFMKTAERCTKDLNVGRPVLYVASANHRRELGIADRVTSGMEIVTTETLGRRRVVMGVCSGEINHGSTFTKKEQDALEGKNNSPGIEYFGLPESLFRNGTSSSSSSTTYTRASCPLVTDKFTYTVRGDNEMKLYYNTNSASRIRDHSPFLPGSVLGTTACSVICLSPEWTRCALYTVMARTTQCVVFVGSRDTLINIMSAVSFSRPNRFTTLRPNA